MCVCLYVFVVYVQKGRINEKRAMYITKQNQYFLRQHVCLKYYPNSPNIPPQLTPLPLTLLPPFTIFRNCFAIYYRHFPGFFLRIYVHEEARDGLVRERGEIDGAPIKLKDIR